MVTKKQAEVFTKIAAADLKMGDRFRDAGSTTPWQEIIFLEKKDDSQCTVVCKTRLDGSFEEYRFEAVGEHEVEVLV